MAEVLEKGHFEVDGKKLEYRMIGPAPALAPTLVFLHEGLGCAAMWRDFPDRLSRATGCGALVYSRAGYGNSDPADLPRPKTYHDDEALRVLPQVLKHAGVKRAVLIGHSDGATIALIHAAAAPGDCQVVGVVAEAPHVFNEEICLSAIRRAVRDWQDGDLRQKLERWHGANAECAFHGWSDTWQRPEFWTWNVEHYLPDITCPVFVIQGEEDFYGSDRQVEAIARQVSGPCETLILPYCGHTPHHEHAGPILETMARFVRAIL
ncbi:alpha/beta fold hydrolase [Telmatospirillum sp. J64-1]|uniref:alpha/beta fold hydrolase n=1 Tax=Telmatospirillum sp. J64-1 TaxID=2502183 RepID=UPI00115EEC62|nr:alpha/beta hydrolase [Telmatospirillum sp. J64-1]